MPSSPLAETPVIVTLALQLKLGSPTNPSVLPNTFTTNLLSVLVVAVPSADVAPCPVRV